MTEIARWLPDGDELDIGRLAGLFSERTNSYKFLFFLALLKQLRESKNTDAVFRIEDLAIVMLLIAAHPVRYYRLFLGTQDQVAKLLDRIEYRDDREMSDADVREAILAAGIRPVDVTRYVPARLITPFLAEDLAHVRESVKDAAIRRLSNERFDAVKPLYRLIGQHSLELHPQWRAYLTKNMAIVTAWAEKHWIDYLQARNPTVPAISLKITRPARRSSLEAQTTYWRAVITKGVKPLSCIYSGQHLAPSGFALDHFVPWTFVCHDAVWNLIPVIPQANSAKHNRLPDPAYLESFIEVQHIGLIIASQGGVPPKVWKAVREDFIGGLHIPESALLDRETLVEAYYRSIMPLLDLARGIGFQPGWRWLPQ